MRRVPTGNRSGRSSHRTPLAATTGFMPHVARSVRPVRECIVNALLAMEIGDGNPAKR